MYLRVHWTWLECGHTGAVTGRMEGQTVFLQWKADLLAVSTKVAVRDDVVCRSPGRRGSRAAVTCHRLHDLHLLHVFGAVVVFFNICSPDDTNRDDDSQGENKGYYCNHNGYDKILGFVFGDFFDDCSGVDKFDVDWEQLPRGLLLSLSLVSGSE